MNAKAVTAVLDLAIDLGKIEVDDRAEWQRYFESAPDVAMRELARRPSLEAVAEANRHGPLDDGSYRREAAVRLGGGLTAEELV